MPIEVRWGNSDKTVIISKHVANWTLQEYYAMIEETFAMITGVAHTVHFIADFTDSSMAPSQILSTGPHVQKRSAPNTGITVVVGGAGFIKALINVARKVFLSNMQIFMSNTIAEAYAIIEQHEKQLAHRTQNIQITD